MKMEMIKITLQKIKDCDCDDPDVAADGDYEREEVVVKFQRRWQKQPLEAVAD